MQWAQLDVTGGTIAAAPVQQQIYAPDTTLYRFMGSLAVDRQGNMALGYPTSNGTASNYPSVAYSGRLATDPLNPLPQTEVQMIAGSGSQTNNCGGAPCDRWGDYSAMSLDPADGCAFWYVNEYYSSQTNGNAGNWQTRIGSFRFPSCASLHPTTTTLASSLNPATINASVTFTATVSGSNPTGTVNFTDGGSSIAGCAAVALTGAGNSRTAVCSTSSLSVGTHSIVANYGGDAANATSSSSPLSQVITAVATTTTMVASSANPATVGATVTFTATVAGTNPTGSVSFIADGGAPLAGCGAVALTGSGNSRTATCSTSSLAVGTHSIVANYSGDAGNAASSSATLSQVISNSTEVVWVDDAVPAGALPASDGGDAWNWISSNPTPYSGTQAHQSVLAGGEHQHYFYNATTTLAVAVGDSLFAYVYLDPANPPSEGMLRWNDGSWEHRAYWGAKLLGWGTDGSVSRRYMGVLPATGQWVRLSVPASQVGLEGRTLNGAAYTLYGGRATWDYAGKTASGGGGPGPTTTTVASSANPATVGTTVTFTATASGTNPTGNVNFTDSGTSISGCASVALSGAGNVRTAACSTSSLAVGSHVIVANYGGDAGNAASSSATLSQVISNSTEVVWVDDAVPAGALPASDGGDAWNWISSNPTPYSGTQAHQSVLAGGEHQHYFYNATTTLAVAVGDSLFAYVYLDPVNPPSEVMLQWNDGSWEHRAYWGANLLGWGTEGSVSRRYMGVLPATGQWVRLSVPASQVGLEGRTLNGAAYTLYGGRATWDYAGKTASGGGGPGPTTTTVASSANPATVGTTVTFTATASGTNPTGNVNFTDSGTSISGCASVALSGAGNVRTAACSTSSLAVGSHVIVANYGGDAGNAASSRATPSQ